MNIYISAVNILSGGPMSVLCSFLQEFSVRSKVDNSLRVHLITASDPAYINHNFPSVELIQIKWPLKSLFHRIYFEYFYLKKRFKLSKNDIWLSLNDTSSNVSGYKKKYVYIHNPLPFNLTYDFFRRFPFLFLYGMAYRFFIKLNINSNSAAFVQQKWIATKLEAFASNVDIKTCLPITCTDYPQKYEITHFIESKTKNYVFFFPAYPRPFKNHEAICYAMKRLKGLGVDNLEVWFTLDGTENKYARKVKELADGINIKFMGILNRDQICEAYEAADALIFPSLIETWGLPISEAIEYQLPILVSQLPYAHETVGSYSKCVFVNPNDFDQIANQMLLFCSSTQVFSQTSSQKYDFENYTNLVEFILNG